MRHMIRALILFYCLTATSLLGDDCDYSNGKIINNTPARIHELLGYTVASFHLTSPFEDKTREAIIRVYLLMDEKSREEVFTRTLKKALEDPLPGDANDRLPDVFELLHRDELARALWDKYGKNLTKGSPAAKKFEQLEAIQKKLPKPPFSLGDVRQLIGKNLKSNTAFLASLPPEYRMNYTLMYDSGASQEADDDDPRTIYYGSEVVVGSNGNPNHRRYDYGEVMYLDPHHATTELYEIGPGKQNPHHVSLSTKNPEFCAQCHGSTSEPHAKWMTYNLWQGAIGQLEDITGSGDSREARVLRNLKAKAPSHPRYRLLEGLKDHFHSEKNIEHVPNGGLGRVLTVHAMTRMLRLMEGTPNFCRYKYAVLAAIEECPDLPSYIPEALRKQFTPYKDISASTKALGEKLKKLYEKTPKVVDGRPPVDFFEERKIAGLRYLFEGRGISMDGWSTDHVTGFGWADGTYNLWDFFPLLRWSDRDLDNGPNEDYQRIGGPAVDCVWLKNESLKALGKLAGDRPSSPGPAVPSHDTLRSPASRATPPPAQSAQTPIPLPE